MNGTFQNLCLMNAKLENSQEKTIVKLAFSKYQYPVSGFGFGV